MSGKYTPINATADDISAVQELSKNKNLKLGVSGNGLYTARGDGAARMSWDLVLEIASTCLLGRQFSSGQMTYEAAAIVADFILSARTGG